MHHPRYGIITHDGSHITFGGINPEISLRQHQLNAIARVLYGGNTLLAHEVGSGKTFEMVAAAMESKRLGLCTKSLFAVPNHLVEQWASEFLRLYPAANILVATKKDFEPHNRKKFCSRIATGDYDAVIMAHSQFERLPISKERQVYLLQEQIEELETGIDELRRSLAESFTIKQLERTKKSLTAKLKKVLESDRKDDVITFEELGVDRLFVDEAHAYKNLFLYTKMRNVAGLSTSEAQKSSDMLLKCRYLDELTGGKGVVFATGTPVSNSMTELFTMQRYLQHDELQRNDLSHFDCWASTFGETVTSIELAPEGTGYRARTRFANFFNLPELMNLFKEIADIKTADQLNLPNVPAAIYHTVKAKPTEQQEEMVKELSDRAKDVHNSLVDPSTDNMLKITSDGRKLGLDQRIIDPSLPDNPDSKVNQCVENIVRIYHEGAAEKLTQLVFCDISTPKGDGAFNIYDDIRNKLIARGIPKEDVAFIHEANTDPQKKDLFANVRTGNVRVLMGSTQKMGPGMNVQDRLIASHDLDCPWRPGDLTQRGGRIIRQGNNNPEAHIYRYVTEGTFDAYLWQTVEAKQRFIAQIMTSKSPVRSCEDVDESTLSYAEIKALATGNPLIKEKMDLDIQLARLRLLKSNHQSNQHYLQDLILKTFPERMEETKNLIACLSADQVTLNENPVPADGFAGIEIGGEVFNDSVEAGAALLLARKDVTDENPVAVGSYRGFTVSLAFNSFLNAFELIQKGSLRYKIELGTTGSRHFIRMDNVLEQIPERLQSAQTQLADLHQQMAVAKSELGQPFPQEAELAQKSARCAELDALLNLDEGPDAANISSVEDSSAKQEPPSVMERLKQISPLALPKKDAASRQSGQER